MHPKTFTLSMLLLQTAQASLRESVAFQHAPAVLPVLPAFRPAPIAAAASVSASCHRRGRRRPVPSRGHRAPGGHDEQYDYTTARFSSPPSGGGAEASSLSLSSSASAFLEGYLDDKQLEFAMGYLNEHHRSDVLIPFAKAYTFLGETFVKKNMWMGGSYSLKDAVVVDITCDEISLEVTVVEKGERVERVSLSLDADPVSSMVREFKPLPSIEKDLLSSTNAVDNFVRRMTRLCNIVKAYSATGKLIQLGVQIGGEGIGKLPDELYLNQVPHNRFVRKYFYDMTANAALEAVIRCSEKKLTNRMKMTVMFPEMNPGMDSYRIGTLLELTRTIAIKLAEQNLRVRVCVQGSMGVGIFTAVPKQLNGVSTLLQRMDWESGPGEENEGMVGTYINFGFVGKEHVVDESPDTPEERKDDVFLLICPQNMIGVECAIIGALSEMVDAAGDRPVILINPDLTDKISSQGQQSVRGRQQRLDFANSFETIFQFQNTYVSGTSYFPILGSTVKLGPTQQWVAHQRRDLANDGGEVYVPVYSSESKPDGETLMKTFD